METQYLPPQILNRFQQASHCGIPASQHSHLNYEYRLTSGEHLHRLSRIARKQTRGTNVDWQDAVQTAQLKLLRAMKAGKFIHGTEQDFDRWAATVAKCEIISLVRKSQRHDWDSTDRQCGEDLTLLVLDTITDPTTLDPLTTLERGDLLACVRQSIVYLDRMYPDRFYYRLWLFKVNDKTQTQIAKELGLTQSAVSKRWKELLAKLLIALDLDSSSSLDSIRSQQQW